MMHHRRSVFSSWRQGVWIGSLCALVALSAYGQPGTYSLLSSKSFQKVEIPFEYENHLMIVKVVFNKVFPLKFIFDTGAEHSILSRKEITDLLAMPYIRDFQILGSDMTTILTAYQVINVHLRIGDLEIPRHSMLVLKEDYFRFDESFGLEIHGIIGADIFKNFVVHIDYRHRKIILHVPKHFRPPTKGFQEIPIEITRNKPYIFSRALLENDTLVDIKLLIDTGAGISVLLHEDTRPLLHLPEDAIVGRIGAGLGGYLEGYLGRLKELHFGRHTLHQVLASYRELPPLADSTSLNRRNGILGNQVLERFELLIDYIHQKLYLKPTKAFDKPFEYDKSGLILVATGANLNQFLVKGVIAGSPAEEAGVRPGDYLHKINGWPATFFSLTDIQRKLRKKEGKQIRLVLRRGEEKLRVQFRLRNLI